MVKLINTKGGITYVADNRVDEYLGAGYTLASKPIEAPKAEEEKKPIVKKAVKTAAKATKKK